MNRYNLEQYKEELNNILLFATQPDTYSYDILAQKLNMPRMSLFKKIERLNIKEEVKQYIDLNYENQKNIILNNTKQQYIKSLFKIL